MKIISAGIQRPAVMILALTSFLLLTAYQASAQDKSRVPAQKGDDYPISHDLNSKTITFEAVNPSNQAPGRMTVALIGAVRGYRIGDGESAAGSFLKGGQMANFSFVPYYPYYPSYSATVRLMQFAGDTASDSIFFDFGLRTTGSDGSVQWFMLKEVVTATEDAAQIAFQQLRLPDILIAHPDLPCGTVLK